MNHLTRNNWISLGGKPIEDIRTRIKKRFDADRFTFHVGTDSKSYVDHTVITTTICFRENKNGALVAYQRNKIKNFNNITERLLHETIVSLEAAKMVQEITGNPMLGQPTSQICLRGNMTTSRKKRRCLLACARKGLTLSAANAHLKSECLDPVSDLQWNLWTNYYLDIVKNDPILENELIVNNRSLAWFANELNRRKQKQMIS